MPVRVSAGFSKKVGLPDYGSQGASCSVEFEIDGSALIDHPESFQKQVRQAHAACRQAVDQELAQRSAPSNGASNGQHESKPAGGADGFKNGSPNGRKATESQIRAIFAIANRNQIDIVKLVQERFGIDRPEDLLVSEASQLIDEMKAPAAGRGALR